MNLFFSFYTGPEYKLLAEECQASFMRFDLPVRLIELMPEGKWMKNCLARAIKLNEIAREHPNCGIGLLDADLTCLKNPIKLKEFNGDIAVHDLTDIGRAVDDTCHRYSAGVQIFGATTLGRVCLQAWADACFHDRKAASGIELREQVYLYDTIEYTKKAGLKVENLGRAYNYAIEPDVTILHHVASRRLRELSGGGM